MERLDKFMKYVEDNFNKEFFYMDIIMMLVELAFFVTTAQLHNLILVVGFFFLSHIQFNAWQEQIKRDQGSN